MFAHVPSQYCHTSLAPSHSREVSPVPINYMYLVLPSHFSELSYCTGSLAESCTFLLFLYIIFTLFFPAPSQYSHTALARLQSPVFSPVPLHYIYVTLHRPLSVVSYRICLLSESCIFSCSSMLYRLFATRVSQLKI